MLLKVNNIHDLNNLYLFLVKYRNNVLFMTEHAWIY